MRQWPRLHSEFLFLFFFQASFSFFKTVNKLHTHVSAMLNWFHCGTSFNTGRSNDNNIIINTWYALPLDLFLDPLFAPLLINQPPSCLWTLAGSQFGTTTAQRSHCFNVNRMLLVFFLPPPDVSERSRLPSRPRLIRWLGPSRPIPALDKS